MKTPQVCPVAGARSPEELYQQYKKGVHKEGAENSEKNTQNNTFRSILYYNELE